MSAINKIKIAWKNRKKIWEGFWASVFPNEYIEFVAAERLKICRSNVCGFHDPLGISEAAYVKNFEACGKCGCKMSFKVRSLSSACPLDKPFWTAKLTEQEEDNFRNKVGINNE